MKFSLQSIRPWAAKNPLDFIVVVLFLLGFMSVIWWHIKPKHPHDLLFDVSSFRIENYYFETVEMVNVLSVLLPIGMPRSEVEKILVGYAGLSPSVTNPFPAKDSTRRRYNYTYPFIHEWAIRLISMSIPRFWITVQYDANDYVEQVYVKSRPVHIFGKNS